MVQNRKQHREPVIRALLALSGETLIEASAFLVAGFVYLPNYKLNASNNLWQNQSSAPHVVMLEEVILK
jgi:hypothetical protein